MSRRSRTSACPTCSAKRIISMQPATCCKSTAPSGSWMSPMSFPASATESSLQARLSELLVGGSLEISPRALHRVADVAAMLPTDSCVYIPSLPGLPLPRPLDAVAAIRAAGLDPVPHVSARRIRDRDEFREFLKKA